MERCNYTYNQRWSKTLIYMLTIVNSTDATESIAATNTTGKNF